MDTELLNRTKLENAFNALYGNGKFHIPPWVGVMLLGIVAGAVCVAVLCFIIMILVAIRGVFVRRENDLSAMAKRVKFWRIERSAMKIATFFTVIGILASGALLFLDYILVIAHEGANLSDYIKQCTPPAYKQYITKNNIDPSNVSFDQLMKDSYIKEVVYASWAVSILDWLFWLICDIAKKVLGFKIRKNERKISKEVEKRSSK